MSEEEKDNEGDRRYLRGLAAFSMTRRAEIIVRELDEARRHYMQIQRRTIRQLQAIYTEIENDNERRLQALLTSNGSSREAR